MTTHIPTRRQIAIAMLLFAVAMTLYTVTLAPSIAALFDDSLEFQLVTYQLGIAHPTGYPLFTMLGWLFTRLPVGEVAFRVNLMSAIFGAITVVLVYMAGLELNTQQKTWAADIGAALGAIALTVSPVFWSQATVAEVYTLHACLVAALLWILLRMSNIAYLVDKHPDHSYATLARYTSALLCVFGFGLAHHRTIVLLLPAILLVLWRIRHLAPLRPRQMIWFFVPLLSYLYLPLRAHVGSLDGSYTNTPEGFLKYIMAWGYGSFILQNPFSVERDPSFYLNLFVQQFGWVGIFFALIGLFTMKRRGNAGGITEIAFVCFSGFNLFYRVADIEVFFIPSFVVWTLWLGNGITRLFVLLQSHAFAKWPLRAYPVARYVIGGLVSVTLAVQSGLLLHQNFPERNRSQDWTYHDYGLDILNQPLEPGATIVGIQGEITLVRYFQTVHKLREDVRTMAVDEPTRRLAVVDDLIGENVAVYLTRPLAGAPERWSLHALGPLIHVRARPEYNAPATAQRVDTLLIPEIALWGYEVTRPFAHTAPPPVRLTLIWHVLGRPTRDLKISARLLTSDGRLVAQTDAAPVHFAYPTTAWRSGEYIPDVYDLKLPEGLSTDTYTPLLILYDPAENAAEVARLTLSPLTLP